MSWAMAALLIMAALGGACGWFRDRASRGDVRPGQHLGTIFAAGFLSCGLWIGQADEDGVGAMGNADVLFHLCAATGAVCLGYSAAYAVRQWIR